MKSRSVAIVTNIPNPYRIPLFNELADRLKRLGYDFQVIFGGEGYSRRKSVPDLSSCRFRYTLLKSRTMELGNAERTMFFYSDLLRHLKREKPDIVIVIGYSLATFKIWLLSRFLPMRYIIWSGSIAAGGRYGSLPRRFQRKFLVKHASGFIAYGSGAKEYLEALGAPSEKIHIAVNTTDTAFFFEEVQKIRAAGAPPDEKKHLLAIGYLTRRKNLIKLLDTIELLAKRRTDFVLDIVGDGEERNRLEAEVKKRDLEQCVLFHGFKQKSLLPAFLAKCDCFLFQTEFDIWGLVLNEAMAAGVPCISSPNAGATRDLIPDGNTGFILDFSDAKSVVDRIAWILDNPQAANEIGRKAAEFVSDHFTIKISADGFISAIRDSGNRTA